MTNVEPGASAATWRSVAAIASRGEVHADAGRGDDRGLAPDRSRRRRAAPTTTPPASKSTGTKRSQSGMPKPSSTRRWRFHACGPGPIDLEHAQARRDVAAALRERVEAGAEDDVLGDARARCSATRSSMKRARPTIDARNGRVPAAPCRAARASRRRAGELQPDLVLEHVRRRIDLDVQRAPQGDPHCGWIRAGRVAHVTRSLSCLHAVMRGWFCAEQTLHRCHDRGVWRRWWRWWWRWWRWW